jgi:antitoxin (DNA-binding transcriptional repressor) of toxin-antitoxin stability system
MPIVNMREAKSQLSRLVASLESGAEEEIIIARNGKPAARLAPIASPAKAGKRLAFSPASMSRSRRKTSTRTTRKSRVFSRRNGAAQPPLAPASFFSLWNAALIRASTRSAWRMISSGRPSAASRSG